MQNSSTVDPIEGGTLVYTDSQAISTTVQVPSGAVTETVTLAYTPVETTTTTPANFAFAGRAFELDAYKEGELQEGFAFRESVTIELHYTEDSIAGLDENSLLLYYWEADPSPGQWVDAGMTSHPDNPSLAYNRHPDQNWLSVSVLHLTKFGLFGKEEGGQLPIYLPIILKS